MKSFLELFLENHAYYHSAGMNAQHWESRFDSLAARAKKELGIDLPPSRIENVVNVLPDCKHGFSVRESSLDELPPIYPRTAEVSPKVSEPETVPVEYLTPKQSSLF